jgi:hypothetical protein
MPPAQGPLHSPIQYVWSAIYRGLKWPGRESNRTPPFSGEVQNHRSSTSARWGEQGEIYMMSNIKLVDMLMTKL